MKHGKKIVVGVLSVLVVVALFFAAQRLVEPKYADDLLEGNFTAEYYEETTKHDVIMVGDCEVYENIDPMVLWHEYGITSYIRGNAQQLTWQSYYMLEDTLKYEKPKAVIYNVQALTHGEPQKEEYNRMTLDGMKWSKTKWDAINASMCKGENMVDYIFPILRYHSRITSLTKSDLTHYVTPRHITHNGYYMRVDVLPASESDVADPSWLLGDQDTASDTGDEEEEAVDPWDAVDDEVLEDDSDASDPWDAVDQKDESTPKEKETEDGGVEFGDYPMQYLEKMRKLCEKNGIQLILMKAPSLAPQWYDSENQQVVDYSNKHDLPYINFYDLLEEIGVDFETDTYDGGLHMNLSGATKLSKYLGKVLSEQYGMKDHRSDASLAKVYDEKYKFHQEMIRKQQKELDDYGEIRSY